MDRSHPPRPLEAREKAWKETIIPPCEQCTWRTFIYRCSSGTSPSPRPSEHRGCFAAHTDNNDQSPSIPLLTPPAAKLALGEARRIPLVSGCER